jgi:hypothetical protein
MFKESLQCCKLLARYTDKQKLDAIRALLLLKLDASVLIALLVMVLWSDKARQKIMPPQ